MYLLRCKDWLIDSKRGKVFTCTLPRSRLNKLKTNAFELLEDRELKQVFPDIFIITYDPLFCQRPVNCCYRSLL